MSRTKGGVVTHRRHKKVLDAAKGYYDHRRRTFKVAKQAVDKANQYATRDRRARKRDFRALWIQRVNAAARSLGISYSKLMGKLSASGIELNRKMLAEIAISDPVAFQQLANA